MQKDSYAVRFMSANSAGGGSARVKYHSTRQVCLMVMKIHYGILMMDRGKSKRQQYLHPTQLFSWYNPIENDACNVDVEANEEVEC